MIEGNVIGALAAGASFRTTRRALQKSLAEIEGRYGPLTVTTPYACTCAPDEYCAASDCHGATGTAE